MPVRQYDEIALQERLARLKDSVIEFSVPWSDKRRVGTVTRVGFDTIWIGAFVYSHHHILDLRERLS